MTSRHWRIPGCVAWAGAILLAFAPAVVGSQPAGPNSPLPEPGGLTALPEQTAETVEVVNGGFEKQLEGWGAAAKPPGFTIASGKGVAHGGDNCLRLNCAETMPYVPTLRQPIKDAAPGIYVLRAWVKLQGVGSKDGRDGARFGIEYLHQNGQRGAENTRVLRDTRDWQEMEVRLCLPADIKPGSVSISIHRFTETNPDVFNPMHPEYRPIIAVFDGSYEGRTVKYFVILEVFARCGRWVDLPRDRG